MSKDRIFTPYKPSVARFLNCLSRVERNLTYSLASPRALLSSLYWVSYSMMVVRLSRRYFSSLLLQTATNSWLSCWWRVERMACLFLQKSISRRLVLNCSGSWMDLLARVSFITLVQESMYSSYCFINSPSSTLRSSRSKSSSCSTYSGIIMFTVPFTY